MILQDESALIEGILRKEEGAVLRFIQQYQDLIYSQSYRMLQNRMDAEEVCQDVFMKALKKIDEFEGKSKLSTWLYSISYKTCLDVLKKRKRRGRELDVDSVHVPEWTDIEDSLSLLENKEQRRLIDEALEQLEATDAVLIELYYLQGMPTKEIAAVTELSEGNIRIRMMRARKKLALLLGRSLPKETLDIYRHGRE